MHDWAELRHFRYLLAILEKGGFHLAAEDLHTSQPNLTVQARQFQDYASVRLYRRLKDRRIQPTEVGLAFISLARFVLEARDAAIDALAAIARGEIESIRLGCNPLVDPGVFHTLCATLKDILPDCRIWPTHGDAVQLTEALLCGDVDAAIAFHRQRCPNIVPFLALKLQKLMQQSANNAPRRESSPAIRVADTPRFR